MVRGNHESCSRAGQGWWRFIDPHPLLAGHDCNNALDDDRGDYSDAYAVPIGGDTQIIVLDTANTINQPIAADTTRAKKYRALYHQMVALSQQAGDNRVVNHQPILGFAARQEAHRAVALVPGNRGLQSVFGSINPGLLPAHIDVLLSGHVHVWEQVSFSSAYPTQFIVGFSGTAEDIVPLPAKLPADTMPAIGAVVAQFSSWVNGFGFMTMQSTGSHHWEIEIRDVNGKQVNACHIDGSKSVCDLAQVQSIQSN